MSDIFVENNLIAKKLLEHEDDDSEEEDESENESEDESEDESEAQYESLNAITLEDIKNILYELHEYFNEFEIEVIACPNLTKEPYNLKFDELDDQRDMNVTAPKIDFTRSSLICSRKNYFFINMKPKRVLKIRAKGRKTNYNIIKLIQNILHKRFWFKIGLDGVLVLKGGHLVGGYVTEDLEEITWYYINCDSDLIAIGTIINDPVLIIGQQLDGLFLTSNRYMFRFYSKYEHDWFINDVTPKETEYVLYFTIAEEVNRY